MKAKTFILAVISAHYMYVACLWLFSLWWSQQLFTDTTLSIVM